MWALTIMVTILFLFPPMFSLVLSLFYGNAVLILMDAAIYSGILGFIWMSYLASDFGTKRLGQYIEPTKLELETPRKNEENTHGSK